MKRKRLRDHNNKYFKGLTLPGYNYLGPFNGNNNGESTNESDRAAKKHDDTYKQYKGNAIVPYVRFTDSDQDFINEVKNDWGGQLGKDWFEKKRKFNEFIGYNTPLRIKNHADQDEPNISPQGVKRTRRSLTNLLQGSTMPDVNMTSGDGDGSGNNGVLKETPIDDVYDVHRGPPDYTFASLPFLQNEKVLGTVSVSDHTFRMTSPYDVRVSYTVADLNAGAGNMSHTVGALDGVDTKGTGDAARWWDLYAGMYDYYHVVSCRWKMTFENLGNAMIYVHQMYHNDEVQPPGATNEDMMCWPDVKSYLLGTHAAAIVAS